MDPKDNNDIKVIKMDNDNIDFSDVLDNKSEIGDPSEKRHVTNEEFKDDMYGKQVESIEDRLLKRRYIIKIKRYCKAEEFQEDLKDFPLNDLEYKNVDELKEIIEEIQFIVATSSCNDDIHMMTNWGLILFENVVTEHSPLDLNSKFKLSSTLMNNKNFRKDLKEFAFMYDYMFYTRVEYRLMKTIMMTGMMVNDQNQKLSPQNQQEIKVDGNINIPDDLKNKYGEL